MAVFGEAASLTRGGLIVSGDAAPMRSISKPTSLGKARYLGVYKSTFLPRILGLILMLGVSSLAFLSPPFAVKYFSWIRIGGVGELLLTLWLLVKRVDSDKWLHQASAALNAERNEPPVAVV